MRDPDGIIAVCAPIAQLDRASGYEPGGRKFESCWAHSKSFVPNDLKKKKEKSAQSWRTP